jgi:hypothetical protein
MIRVLHFEYGCVAQLVEQRSPKPPVGGSIPSALVVEVGKKTDEVVTWSWK